MTMRTITPAERYEAQLQIAANARALTPGVMAWGYVSPDAVIDTTTGEVTDPSWGIMARRVFLLDTCSRYCFPET